MKYSKSKQANQEKCLQSLSVAQPNGWTSSPLLLTHNSLKNTYLTKINLTVLLFYIEVA